MGAQYRSEKRAQGFFPELKLQFHFSHFLFSTLFFFCESCSLVASGEWVYGRYIYFEC